MTDKTPATEAGLLDLAANRQMPDNARPDVSLGEIRKALAQARTEALDVEALAEAIEVVAGYNTQRRIRPGSRTAGLIAAEYQRILAAKETP